MLNLNIFEMGLVAAGGLFLLSLLIGAFFIWIGAKLARIPKRTFGRAIIAALASSVATWLVAWIFSFFPGSPWWSLIGAVVGLLVVLAVFKSVFDTTWGKAFLIWLLQVVAIFLAIVIAAFTFAAALII